jgi:hypothetical protein
LHGSWARLLGHIADSLRNEYPPVLRGTLDHVDQRIADVLIGNSMSITRM